VLCWRDCVDDDQLTTATWTKQCENTRRLISIAGAVVIGAIRVRFFGPEQLSDAGDIGGTITIAVEAVVANAVLASGEHMDQEPTDEFIRGQGHGGVAVCAFDAVIFDTKGDALVVHTDQSAVGNGDPMRVSRQICQYGSGSGKGFFGVDYPIDFAQRFEEIVEDGLVGKVYVIAEEVQFSSIVQLG